MSLTAFFFCSCFVVAFALPKIRPETCAFGCLPTMINDGYCDSACFNLECGYDGGDCVNHCVP
eukprot:Awhi_evm1s5959